MEALELIARLGLALVFAVSGVAKLLDRQGSREALAGFGVPERIARPGALLLPLGELAVAALLIPAPTATVGAAGAVVLLLAFCAGIARSMARGEAPDCHCFGQLHSEPVGWRTLARNLVLLAAASVALATGLDGESAAPFAWVGTLDGAVVVSIAAFAVIAALLLVGRALFLSLLNQNGRLLLRVEALEAALARRGVHVEAVDEATKPAGPPVGSPAPSFELTEVRGGSATLESLLAPGRRLLLVFTDSSCGPCNALLPQLAAWQREREDLTVAVIARGVADENLAKASEHGVDAVYVESGNEVSESYDALVTPSAVLVSPHGTIASSVARGETEIRALAERAHAAQGRAPVDVIRAGGSNGGRGPGPARGTPAPPLEFSDLDGNDVALADFRGDRALLLFWDPACGFCRRMLPDLIAWESERPPGAPRALVISRGSAEANRAMGLDSTVVLDPESSAARAFGATGTPSAILLDEEGRVASELGVGAPASLALAAQPA